MIWRQRKSTAPKTAISLAALLFLSLTVLVASPSSAVGGQAAAAGQAEWAQSADEIWDVVNPDPNVRHTGLVRALVRDLVEYEGHMYVAGRFLDVESPAGLTFSQPYLARFDLATGVWDSTYRPEVDAIIYAIEITNDGSLYAAGELEGGIAKYDTASGARDRNFDPEFENVWGPPAVYDIEAVGGQIYAGGTFTKVGSQVVRDLARIDSQTGQIDTAWLPVTDFDLGTPRSGGRNIFGLAVDSTRGRVYLAGKFGGINGDTDAAYFATINTVDGELLASVPQGLPANIPDHRESFSMWMMDVQWSGDTVYVGGQGHQTMILDVDTLLPRHTFFSNRGVGDNAAGGDTQVIFVGSDTIWSGCHCWGSVGEYELGSYNAQPDGMQTYAEYRQWVLDFRDIDPFGQQPVGGGYGIDKATESLVPLSFDVTGQAGAYAIVEDSLGRVWFGGQYLRDRQSGRSLHGIARFSQVDGQAAPANFVSTIQTRERVVLRWDAAPGAVGYQILRGGTELAATTGRWYTDRSVDPATTYAYQVEAVYADGSISERSDILSVATKGVVVVPVAPTGLRSTLQTRERVVLTWDRLDSAVEYQVVRDGNVVGTSGGVWFTNRDLTAATTYSYQVIAVFADGSLSDPSAAETVVTDL